MVIPGSHVRSGRNPVDVEVGVIVLLEIGYLQRLKLRYVKSLQVLEDVLFFVLRFLQKVSSCC